MVILLELKEYNDFQRRVFKKYNVTCLFVNQRTEFYKICSKISMYRECKLNYTTIKNIIKIVKGGKVEIPKYDLFNLEWRKFYEDNREHLRKGQCLVICLQDFDPDVYELLKLSYVDCFYSNKLIEDSLRFLRDEWDGEYIKI